MLAVVGVVLLAVVGVVLVRVILTGLVLFRFVEIFRIASVIVVPAGTVLGGIVTLVASVGIFGIVFAGIVFAGIVFAGIVTLVWLVVVVLFLFLVLVFVWLVVVVRIVGSVGFFVLVHIRVFDIDVRHVDIRVVSSSCDTPTDDSSERERREENRRTNPRDNSLAARHTHTSRQKQIVIGSKSRLILT
ncbi:hypothetical protein [Halorubrum salsamenti]|uniref:hypothetical protein n=1 Tax=Halorubrum salsamenti TaxID=2583990 RepID=UPI0019D573EB|nr:hypothetical protein [Halorubrum salsamenti]